MKVHFILPVTIRKRFSFQQTIEDINFGRVGMYVKPYRIYIRFGNKLYRQYIDNPYFEGIVNQIYPPELQLNKANTSYTAAPFLFTSIYF